MREQVGVGWLTHIAESCIRVDEYWIAGPNRARAGAPRKGLQYGTHLRRTVQRRRCLACCRHSYLGCRCLVLTKTLIIKEKEQLLFDDRAAESHSVLSHSERRNGRIAVEVEVVEVPRIEDGIPQIAESRAVKIIGTRFGDDVNLSAGLRAVFRVVQSAVDAVLLDCILRNLQTGLRLLGLLLNTAGIDAVKLKVVVVSCAAGEANRTLITATVILRKGREA